MYMNVNLFWRCSISFLSSWISLKGKTSINVTRSNITYIQWCSGITWVNLYFFFCTEKHKKSLKNEEIWNMFFWKSGLMFVLKQWLFFAGLSTLSMDNKYRGHKKLCKKWQANRYHLKVFLDLDWPALCPKKRSKKVMAQQNPTFGIWGSLLSHSAKKITFSYFSFYWASVVCDALMQWEKSDK